jgi:citrate synthase
MWGPEHAGRAEEDRLAMLEEYQRDLEQEVEDVAERIRRIKEDKANA